MTAHDRKEVRGCSLKSVWRLILSDISQTQRPVLRNAVPWARNILICLEHIPALPSRPLRTSVGIRLAGQGLLLGSALICLFLGHILTSF